MKRFFSKFKVITLCVAMAISMIQLPAAADDSITVHIVGDSTVCNYGEEWTPRTGWGQMLRKYLSSDVSIINKAVSGASARSLYNGLHKSSRQTKWDTDVLPNIKSGDYVLIAYGHNDRNNDNRYSTADGPSTEAQKPEGEYDKYGNYNCGAGSFKWYITQFVENTKAKGATPIIVSPTVVRVLEGNDEVCPVQETLVPYIDALEVVAEEQNIDFIDINTPMRELVKSYGLEGSKRLYMHTKPGEYPKFPDGSTDNIHLTEYGATEVARLVAERLFALDNSLKDKIVGVTTPVYYASNNHSLKGLTVDNEDFTVRLQALNKSQTENNYIILTAFFDDDSNLISVDLSDWNTVGAGKIASIDNLVSVPAGVDGWLMKNFVWCDNCAPVGEHSEYNCLLLTDIIAENFESFTTDTCVFENGPIKYKSGATISPGIAACDRDGDYPLKIKTLADNNKVLDFLQLDQGTAPITGQSILVDFGRAIDCSNTDNGELVFSASFKKYDNKYPCISMNFLDGSNKEILNFTCAQLFTCDYDFSDGDTRDYSINTNTSSGDRWSYFGTMQEMKVVFSSVTSTVRVYYNNTLLFEKPYIEGQETVAGVKIALNNGYSRNLTGFALDNITAYIDR